MQLHRIITLIAVITFGNITFSAAGPSEPLPVQTVAKVDPSRYMGRWYEIARLPNKFQNGCVGSYADYSLRDDGQISVLNSCRNEKDDKLRQAKGRAWVVDHTSNARLKVSFFWPFRGDYWIIKLGKEYEYTVVATPNRKYLWILSRTPTMSDDLFTEIMKEAEQQGFDTKKIIKEVLPPQDRHLSAGK